MTLHSLPNVKNPFKAQKVYINLHWIWQNQARVDKDTYTQPHSFTSFQTNFPRVNKETLGPSFLLKITKHFI